MQFQDIRTGELVKKRFEWAVIIELRIGRNPKTSFNCERSPSLIVYSKRGYNRTAKIRLITPAARGNPAVAMN